MKSAQPSLFGPLAALCLQVLPAAAQNEPATPLSELPLDTESADVAPPPEGATSESADPSAAGAVRKNGRYGECLGLARDDPRSAIDFAFAWQSEDGSLAAKHCAAVAYSALDRVGLAAQRLGEIARDLRSGRDLPGRLRRGETRAELLARIYAQLGNARLLQGNVDAAYSAFSSGLAALPGEAAPMRAELLVDRARTLGAGGDFDAALADLEAARRLAPDRGEIALFMASAYRGVGELEAALAAVDAAIGADGESAMALLERGNIRMLREDTAAARRDWEAVVARWPDSAAAGAARTNIARLDGAP